MKRVYSNCKEKGDVTPFWNFAIVSLNEFELIISHNPEPFFRNISNEQFKAYSARLQACVRAARELAKYDPEIARLVSICDKESMFENSEQAKETMSDINLLKKKYTQDKTLKEILDARRAEQLK